MGHLGTTLVFSAIFHFFFFPLLYSGYTYLYFYVRSKRVPASDFTGWILGELDEGGWAVNELRLRRRGDAIYPR